MQSMKVTDVLAQAFKAEGVEVLYALMGDANMYWAAKMADEYGVQVVHAPARTLRCRYGGRVCACHWQSRRRDHHLRARVYADHDGADHCCAR